MISWQNVIFVICYFIYLFILLIFIRFLIVKSQNTINAKLSQHFNAQTIRTRV